MLKKQLLKLSFVIILFSQHGIADTIFLTNGDKISGKISSMQKNELKFITPYAEINVPWGDIKNIKSDESITIEFDDLSQFSGLLLQTEQGPSLKNPNISSPVPINLSNIKSINPPVISNDAEVDGSIHLGGSKASGNTQTQSFHADANITAKAGNNKFTAAATYNQDANKGVESSNNLYAKMQYDHYFMPKWYASLFTDFSKDRFQDLNSRTSFGAGLGHEIWNSDIRYLTAEIGLAYTTEDFNEAEDREFMAGRWAIDYHHWFIKDRLQFFHNHEGTLSLEGLDDFMVRTHTGFKLPVYLGFDFLTQVDLDYDNKPAEGKKATDTRYIVGVGYAW